MPGKNRYQFAIINKLTLNLLAAEEVTRSGTMRCVDTVAQPPEVEVPGTSPLTSVDTVVERRAEVAGTSSPMSVDTVDTVAMKCSIVDKPVVVQRPIVQQPPATFGQLPLIFGTPRSIGKGVDTKCLWMESFAAAVPEQTTLHPTNTGGQVFALGTRLNLFTLPSTCSSDSSSEDSDGSVDLTQGEREFILGGQAADDESF